MNKTGLSQSTKLRHEFYVYRSRRHEVRCYAQSIIFLICFAHSIAFSQGAIHSTKISGNFGPKLNGSVRSNRKNFEKTGPPFEVVLFSRSDRSEFWLNGSRPMKIFVFSVASRATGRLQIKPSGSGDENDRVTFSITFKRVSLFCC